MTHMDESKVCRDAAVAAEEAGRAGATCGAPAPGSSAFAARVMIRADAPRGLLPRVSDAPCTMSRVGACTRSASLVGRQQSGAFGHGTAGQDGFRSDQLRNAGAAL